MSRAIFQNFSHTLFPDPSSWTPGCRCQCCLSNENETFLIVNENEELVPKYAIGILEMRLIYLWNQGSASSEDDARSMVW